MDDLDLLAQRLEAVLPTLMRGLALPPEEDPLADLTPSQLRFVRALEPAERPLSELSAALGMSLSAATQLCQRLEEAGLVRRHCRQADRRVKVVGLSVSGKERLRLRRQLRVANAKRLLSEMPERTRFDILVALEKVAESVDSVAPTALIEAGA